MGYMKSISGFEIFIWALGFFKGSEPWTPILKGVQNGAVRALEGFRARGPYEGSHRIYCGCQVEAEVGKGALFGGRPATSAFFGR